MSFLTAFRIAVWGRPADTKEERRFLVKIDVFILTSCCLQYWTPLLDRANLNNAYVSGMKEDLAMPSNELNQINTVFWCVSW
ncbi:hypothetical protein EJ04DRAFT_446640 [Polyplosphaeria fusca]|uniref:Uncharacterized protein n=1 Tax=Polyplosphaeria fusca TaxID=682080 RepID=A0A9P4QLW6_9PLEO|nr:hypothetical protein EJ04DRAFT_446640 [Polyplosphaeria fusca]